MYLICPPPLYSSFVANLKASLGGSTHLKRLVVSSYKIFFLKIMKSDELNSDKLKCFLMFLIESSVILFVLILKEILFSTEITYWLQILLEILYNTDNQHKILFWISQIFNILTVNWKKIMFETSNAR